MNVSNFKELKAAIEDSVTTEITVTQDITFESGGARVNVAKSNLVIDFGGHNVTDNNSSSFTDTIYIPSTTNTISVTAKNAVWTGRNYYGVIGSYDGNTNSTTILSNINYTGPQFGYNKNGTTKIDGCTVVLDKGSSSTNPQEFCEANRVIISGNVSVTSNSTSNAVIWFTNVNAALTVEENATFKVTALSTYFLYTDVSPVMTFKKGSSTTITTKGGLFYTTGTSSHIAQSFIMEENSSFVATKTTNNSVPMLKCISTMSIAQNATFNLFSPQSSSAALVYFAQAANVTFDRCKSIVFYNNGGNVFSFATGSSSNPNKISIISQILRTWQTAKTPLTSAGGFDDVATSTFHKSDYSNSTTEITSTNSQILTLTNNLADGDSGYPMTTATLNLLSCKVFALGSLLLSANPVSDQSTNVSGTADASANILAKFQESSLTATATTAGEYSVTLPEKLAVNTVVNISANKNFLVKTQTLTVTGSVSITKISPLKFIWFSTKPQKSQIGRVDPNWEIEITDTRVSGDEWYLYAYINSPLTSGNNKLENSLVLKQNDTQTTLSESPILVYTGKFTTQNAKTNITWSEIEGFLLATDPTKTYVSGKYDTQILWQISTTKLQS